MPIAVSDLFCATCGAYTHLFLDACPICAASRTPRLEEALRGADLGVARLATDPGMRERAERLMRTTALTTSHGIGSALAGVPELPGGEEPDYAALINELTGRLRYRAWLTPGETALIAEAQVRVAAGRLQVSSAHHAGVVVDAPLAVLHGVAGPSPRTARAATQDPTGPRDAGRDGIVVAWSAAGSPARLALANPAGLFATKARPDHYEALAWWLGIAAAAAAERRWREIGVAAHAAELGIEGWEPTGTNAAPSDAGIGAQDSQPGGPPSVAQALRTLEELRAGGLVDQAEYDAKRREILSRL